MLVNVNFSQSTWQMHDGFASGVPTDFWLIVSQAGAFRFNGSTWECFTDQNGLFEIGSDKGWITSAVIDHLGRTWFSICNPHDTVFVRYADHQWEEIARAPLGYEQQIAYCLAVDKHGALWVSWENSTGMGYSQGLWAFNSVSGQWNQYKSKNSALLSQEISTLAADKLGRIWVGTREGVSVFDGTESGCWTAIIPSEPSKPLRRKVSTKGWSREKVLRHVWVSDKAIVDSAGRIWARDHHGISVFTEMQEDQMQR